MTGFRRIFPKDAHGLADFDGNSDIRVCRSQDSENIRIGERKYFDYGKAEVRNFLIAKRIILDRTFPCGRAPCGCCLRRCSILITEKQDGQWVANKYGGNENLEAIDFFKTFEFGCSGTEQRRCDDRGRIDGMAEGDRIARRRRPWFQPEMEYGMDARFLRST